MDSNTHVLPPNFMQMLGYEGQVDNRETIVEYLVSTEGAIELTEFQQTLLNRWSHADDLMRSDRYTNNEIIELLCKKYNYNVATARRDIGDAQYVFGSATKVDKRYLLANHVAYLKGMMILYAKQGKSKELVALAQVYTNALKAMPDDTKGNTTPAAIILYFDNRTAKYLQETPIEDVDAEVLMSTILKDKGINPQTLEHE